MNYPELSNEHDESIHVSAYADMIDKLTYVQKADFAKRALELERDCATYKKMFEEVSRERNAWISEYRAAREEIEDAKYEIETLRGQIIDRDIEIKNLKEDLEELSDTLGLRNRSNPDLTIDP